MTHPTVSIIDFGNAYLKAVTNHSRTKIIPACIHKLTTAQQKEKRTLTDSSPLITINSDKHLVGDEAIEYGGSNNWSGDKLSNILLGIFAAHSHTQKIDQLVVCVPDATMDLNFESLKGCHSYLYNDRQVQIEIGDIEAVDETYGIWLGAQKLYLKPDQNNIAITIGAGTVNLTCYSGKGAVRYRAVSKLGMMWIADKVARDLKTLHGLPATPSLSLIMRGMAQGNYQLTGTNIDFSHQLQSAIGDWKKALKDFIVDSCPAGITYWQFAIGGAGAAYLPSGTSTLVVPNPQTFAIESLLALYEN